MQTYFDNLKHETTELVYRPIIIVNYVFMSDFQFFSLLLCCLHTYLYMYRVWNTYFAEVCRLIQGLCTASIKNST